MELNTSNWPVPATVNGVSGRKLKWNSHVQPAAQSGKLNSTSEVMSVDCPLGLLTTPVLVSKSRAPVHTEYCDVYDGLRVMPAAGAAVAGAAVLVEISAASARKTVCIVEYKEGETQAKELEFWNRNEVDAVFWDKPQKLGVTCILSRCASVIYNFLDPKYVILKVCDRTKEAAGTWQKYGL